MIRTALVAAGLVLGLTTVMAQSDPIAKAVDRALRQPEWCVPGRF